MICFDFLSVGEGLFSLLTEDGSAENIFLQITKRFEEIKYNKHSQSSASSSSAESDSDNEEVTPDLPPRNYKQDTLKSLFARREGKVKASKGKKTKTTKPSTSSKYIPDQSYDEVVIPSAASSSNPTPSFLNSLIRRHKDSLSPISQLSDTEDSMYESLGDYKPKNNFDDIYSDVYSLPEQ